MDFISCRNFLIYLDTAAQKKAIATFHYALNEGGCLMLGKSETIGTLAQLFAPLNKKNKIYSRIKNSAALKIPDLKSGIPHTIMPEKISAATKSPKKAALASNTNLGSAFDAMLLAQYMPASVESGRAHVLNSSHLDLSRMPSSA